MLCKYMIIEGKIHTVYSFRWLEEHRWGRQDSKGRRKKSSTKDHTVQFDLVGGERRRALYRVGLDADFVGVLNVTRNFSVSKRCQWEQYVALEWMLTSCSLIFVWQGGPNVMRLFRIVLELSRQREEFLRYKSWQFIQRLHRVFNDHWLSKCGWQRGGGMREGKYNIAKDEWT